MSHIDQLIAELCPSGVEFRQLGEVVTNLDSQRRPVTRSARLAGEYPYYGANGIQDYVDDFLFDGTFLLLGEDGSVVNSDGSPVLNWAVGKIWVNNHAHVLTSRNDDVDLRFLYFYLQTVDISWLVTGSAQPKLNQRNMNRVPVPVPPLVVQREIVNVLDTFTALEAELEAKLDAELEARHRQYVHYRRVILDQVQADLASVSSLGRWQGGITPSKANPAYWESGTIPWLTSMDVSNTRTDDIRGRVTARAVSETSLRLVPAPSVAVVMRSNILRRTLPIGLIKVDTTVNQDMRVLVPRQGVDAEYVFQALRADGERIRTACVRTDGSMAAVDSQGFFAWEIPLPSLAEQRRVAEKLRYFDHLVNDLSIGLPAELRARRQQYEYYRDKLLTFPEAAA